MKSMVIARVRSSSNLILQTQDHVLRVRHKKWSHIPLDHSLSIYAITYDAVFNNIHSDGPDKRWTHFNRRHGNRFVFHHTPKHASWVNQVELFFSILQRECLRHGSFLSEEDLRKTVLDFVAYWNRERARPFRWTFSGYPLQSGLPKAC